MIEFTLDELMEIHECLITKYCYPELSKSVNGELMRKVVKMIEDSTIVKAQNIIKDVVNGEMPVSIRRHSHSFKLKCDDCGNIVTISTTGKA